jgi:pilus assembly protein Flp/PilA
VALIAAVGTFSDALSSMFTDLGAKLNAART